MEKITNKVGKNIFFYEKKNKGKRLFKKNKGTRSTLIFIKGKNPREILRIKVPKLLKSVANQNP